MNKQGPNLHGIIGRTSGSVDGFAYSAANKNSGITWTEDILSAYLVDPAKYIKGTKARGAGRLSYRPAPLHPRLLLLLLRCCCCRWCLLASRRRASATTSLHTSRRRRKQLQLR